MAYEGGWWCCCKSCWHFDDEFDREDSTTIGGHWWEVDGDWEIQDNTLVALDESPDLNLIYLAKRHYKEPYHQHVKVKARFNFSELAVGDTFRLLGFYNENDGSYIALEIEVTDIDDPFIDVIARCIGGDGSTLAEKEITHEYVGSLFWEFALWHTGLNHFCAQAFSDDLFTVEVNPPSGVYSGLYVEQDTAAAFSFRDFRVAMHGMWAPFVPCSSCDCTCQGFYLPAELEVAITFIGSCPCPEATTTYPIIHKAFAAEGETAHRAGTGRFWATGNVTCTNTAIAFSCSGDDPTEWVASYLGGNFTMTEEDIAVMTCSPLYLRWTKQYAPSCVIVIEVYEP